jgi:hypothetical protein
MSDTARRIKMESAVVTALFLLVGKLRLLTKLIRDQLKSEYYFQPAIQHEWAEGVKANLEPACYALEQFFRTSRHFGSDPTFLESQLEYWFFKRQIERAMSRLSGQGPVVDAICGATSEIVVAHFRLDAWQQTLLEAGANPLLDVDTEIVYPPLPPELARKLANGMESAESALAAAIREKKDLQICRTSRILFLLCFATYASRSELWSPERRAHVLELHRLAVATLQEPEALVHTQERFTKLQELTPRRCEEMIRTTGRVAA